MSCMRNIDPFNNYPDAWKERQQRSTVDNAGYASMQNAYDPNVGASVGQQQGPGTRSVGNGMRPGDDSVKNVMGVPMYEMLRSDIYTAFDYLRRSNIWAPNGLTSRTAQALANKTPVPQGINSQTEAPLLAQDLNLLINFMQQRGMSWPPR